jgi:hypothetical protein
MPGSMNLVSCIRRIKFEFGSTSLFVLHTAAPENLEVSWFPRSSDPSAGSLIMLSIGDRYREPDMNLPSLFIYYFCDIPRMKIDNPSPARDLDRLSPARSRLTTRSAHASTDSYAYRNSRCTHWPGNNPRNGAFSRYIRPTGRKAQLHHFLRRQSGLR